MRDGQVEVDGEHGHVWVAVGYVFDGLGDGAVCRVVCCVSYQSYIGHGSVESGGLRFFARFPAGPRCEI